jgi:DNA helicase-2/ATP-dependent DNA helicase PcrA
MEFIQKYIHAYPASDLQQFIRYLHVSWEVNDIFIDPVWVKKIDGVQIMTVHQSKGKEFPHVMIPFMASNSFPPNFQNKEYIQHLPVHWRHWDVNERSTKELHYEEERRIFYVGITRAEETLTLFGPDKRQSQFTKDLQPPFIEREKIMKEATPTEKIDGLLATYQQKLMDSMTFEKWDDTDELLYAIKCITDIKNNISPQWNNNTYEQKILAELTPLSQSTEIKSPLTLSATTINSYLKCPLQYRFKEVDKIPVLSKKPYFQLGKVVHDVLEHFHRNKLSTKDELLSLLDEFWSNEGFEYKQEESQYRADAIYMLENYYNYFLQHPHHPQFVEESFSFDLKNCTLKGRCDRIDVNADGGVEIYDYKTSKSNKLPTEKELKKDMQLAIYALFSLHYGVRNESDEPKKQIPEKVALLLLRQEEIESSIRFELDELLQKKEEIEAIADNIYEKKFDAIPGFYCNYCEYKDLICPKFNES